MSVSLSEAASESPSESQSEAASEAASEAPSDFRNGESLENKRGHAVIPRMLVTGESQNTISGSGLPIIA
jgi:hypothetical protein